MLNSDVGFFIFKAAFSGIIIAAISSLSKVSSKWGALLTALPMMTYLSLFWIYWETKDLKLLENYTRDVFIWIFPGLFFFISAIFLFRARVNFYISMSIATLILFSGFFIFEKTGILSVKR